MAKAGFWLRGARGKLAGASVQRGQNGTILREIVKPRNPRTDKQYYQRAIMATVMKAYSAGKAIFDHAFQGVQQGQKSQQHFISVNARLLRAYIAKELEAMTQPLNCNAAVIAPKSLYPVPNEYMISEGTYPQNFFVWSDTGKNFTMPAALEAETVAQYAQRNNLIPGDIYTFVAFVVSDNQPSFTVRGITTATTSVYKPESQYPASFAFVRLQVNDVSNISTAAEGTSINTLFTATASVNSSFNLEATSIGDSIPMSDVISNVAFPAAIDDLGSFGCIRSRLDQDLRSTSYMHVCSMVADRANNGMYGIPSALALDAWKQGTDVVGTSELILESDTDSGFIPA